VRSEKLAEKKETERCNRSRRKQKRRSTATAKLRAQGPRHRPPAPSGMDGLRDNEGHTRPLRAEKRTAEYFTAAPNQPTIPITLFFLTNLLHAMLPIRRRGPRCSHGLVIARNACAVLKAGGRKGSWPMPQAEKTRVACVGDRQHHLRRLRRRRERARRNCYPVVLGGHTPCPADQVRRAHTRLVTGRDD